MAPRWFKKAVKRSLGQAGKCAPVVRVVQAGHGVLKIGQAVNKCIDVAENVNQAIPAMQLMAGSLCDKTAFVSTFVGILQAAGIVANIIQTYQGIEALREIEARLSEIGNTLEAQTALQARTDFSNLVYDELWDRLTSTSQDKKSIHWYIVYHPDTIWYAHFNRRIRENPLSKRFCGYTNCLDMAILFVKALRNAVGYEQRFRDADKRTRTIKIHLLIPAYRLLFIPEFVKFPGGLGSFVVEGAIHNSKHLVWLNIPEEQSRFLFRVENWKPPQPSFFQKIGAPIGLAKLPPENKTARELGKRLAENEDNDNSSVVSSAFSTSSEGDLDDMDPNGNFSNDRASYHEHCLRRANTSPGSLCSNRPEDRQPQNRCRNTRHHKRKEIRHTSTREKRNSSRNSRRDRRSARSGL